MARQKGTANFSGTIEVLAGGPIDARDIVQTKADLTAANSFPYLYVGMETFVLSEKKKYRLIGQDPTDIDNWEEVGAGGGGTEYTAGDGISISNDTISTDASVYRSADTAETTIADDDYFPFYDNSASAKKKSLWSNIKSVLKTYFDTLYPSVGGHTIEDPEGTALTQRDTLQFGGDLEVSDDDENEKTVVSPHELTAAELAEIVTPLPSVPVNMPILFDETGAEHVVGWYKYANGTKKPIYQKTISITLSNNGDNQINHNIENVDNIMVDLSHSYVIAGSEIFPLVCVNQSLSTFTYDVVLQWVTTIKIDILAGSGRLGSGYVTLQYTKTTDTPT